MDDLDRFIWECSDEKIMRIVNVLVEKEGMTTSRASDLLNTWRECGWRNFTNDDRRKLLRVIGKL